MSDNLPKLLPCPFCGDDATFEGAIGYMARAICRGCGASGSRARTTLEAADQWNRRTELFPDKRLDGLKPLVLYFANDADRAEVVAVILQVKPGMKTVSP